MRGEAGAEIAKVSVDQKLSKEYDSSANNLDQTSAFVIFYQSQQLFSLKVFQHFIIPGVSLRSANVKSTSFRCIIIQKHSCLFDSACLKNTCVYYYDL